jgi:hypothetical protein
MAMGLQTRALFLCFLIALLLISIFSWFYFKSLSPALLAQSEQTTLEKSRAPQVFFEQEKNSLAQLTQVIGLTFTHYADSAEKQPDDLIKNLKKLDADWLYLSSESGAPLLSMLVNPLFSKGSVQALVQQLQADYPTLANKTSNDAQTTLIHTSEGPALLSMMKLPFKVASQKITAYLYVCRFIDGSLQEKLAQLIPQSNIWPLAQSPLSAAQSQLLATFSSYPDGYVVTNLHNEKWRSYSALKDIAGNPQVLIETNQPRILEEVIFNGFIFVTSAALGLLVLLLIGLNVILNQYLYHPLHQILAQLSVWVEKTRIKGDLEVQGARELEPLTQLINQVIKVINYHQSAALSHAFHEGLNEMRENFIKEIKRLTKPIVTNLNELEVSVNDESVNNLETTMTDMLSQISNLDTRAAFLRELQSRSNQIRLIQKGIQSKINDTKNKCLHLSTLLQAHTVNFDQTKLSESKIKSQGT